MLNGTLSSACVNTRELGWNRRAAVKVFPQFRMGHEERVAREGGAVGPPGLEVSAAVR